MKKDDIVSALKTILVVIGMFLVVWLIVIYIKALSEPEDLPEFTHWNDEPKYQLIMNMDSSCFDQFKNNQDKTLFLKLRFEE